LRIVVSVTLEFIVVTRADIDPDLDILDIHRWLWIGFCRELRQRAENGEG
jgi:hypothetical protein